MVDQSAPLMTNVRTSMLALGRSAKTHALVLAEWVLTVVWRNIIQSAPVTTTLLEIRLFGAHLYQVCSLTSNFLIHKL